MCAGLFTQHVLPIILNIHTHTYKDKNTSSSKRTEMRTMICLTRAHIEVLVR